MNHNLSATKQCLHPQSVAKIGRHSVLSGDRTQQCGRSKPGFQIVGSHTNVAETHSHKVIKTGTQTRKSP